MKSHVSYFGMVILVFFTASGSGITRAGPKVYPGEVAVLGEDAYKIERPLGRGALSDIYLVTDPSGRSHALKLYRYGSPEAQEVDADPFGTVMEADDNRTDPFPTTPLDHPNEKQTHRTNEEILRSYLLAARLSPPLFLPISKPGIYTVRGTSATYAGHLMPVDQYRALAEPALIKLTSMNTSAIKDSALALRKLMTLNYLANQLLEMAIAAHETGVALVDIKPGNITVHPNFLLLHGAAAPILRFRDYDSLVEAGSKPISATPLFTPPEVRQGHQAVGINTDLYSIGLTLLTQMQGYHPAGSPSVQAVRQWEAISEGQSANPFVNALFSRWRAFLNPHREWSERLKTIITHSLNVVPEARLEGLVDAKVLSRSASGQLAVLPGCL